MEGYPSNPQTPDPVSGLTQGIDTLNVSEPRYAGRHKRPARVYHNINSQPEAPAYGAGIRPVGSPFQADPNAAASILPQPQQPGFQQPQSSPAGFIQPQYSQFGQPQQQQQQPVGFQSSFQQASQPAGFPTGPQPGSGLSSRNLNQTGAQGQGQVYYTGADGIPKMNTERASASQKLPPDHLFKTFENACPPAAGTDYNVADQGLSGPQYTRLTMYNVPTTEALRSSLKLPLGLILRPFAPFSNKEYEKGGVTVADFSQDIPPPRCTRCRTYMNPSMMFDQGGTSFICNMCQFSNPVSAEYFQPVDPSGRRIDWHQRPELAFGTYDIAVPKEYWKDQKVEPSPLNYFFMIDVSQEAIQKGLHLSAVKAIKNALYGSGINIGEEAQAAIQRFSEKDEAGNPMPSSSVPLKFPKGARIGIATFDRTVHFYNINENLEQPQAYFMSDLADPFVPIENGLFVDPEKSRAVIESLFDLISGMFSNNSLTEPVFGVALEAAYQALEKTGGKVSVILGSLPSYGPGAIAVRSVGAEYQGEREKELFIPDNKYHKEMGKKFALAGIGLDLFIFPTALIELSNVGIVSQLSGGHEYYYPRYVIERDENQFVSEFTRSVQNEIGTQVSLKIRCSTGLQVSAYFGNFFHEDWDQDPTMGTVDSRSTFGAMFKYDGKLDPKLDVHFQSALLYTSSDGQKRVRINNVIASVTSDYNAAVNFIDADACMGIMARENLSRMGEFTLKELRMRLNDRLIDIFSAYRQKVASNLPASQLLMPMSMRTIIPYILSLQKSRPFRDQKLTPDLRVHAARIMNDMSVDELSVFLYPRIMGLHNLQENDSTYAEDGQFIYPTNVSNTTENIDAGGVYVVFNGVSVLLWIHRQVSPALLTDLFGEEVTSLETLNPSLNTLPEIDTDVSIKARRLIKYLANRSGLEFLGIQIARQGHDGSDYELPFSLVEDPGTETYRYRDYVAFIHGRVKSKLENNNEKSTMSYLSGHFPFSSGI
ncbi:uncharacterized protein SAPINGB_P005188 [Magnusiomyces paraingens]|uniref:Uncharacterized protein n=1 Tax=Magnusiomyces paraingens TaxID=2606893 RepID=A0A5E8BYX4_9ASCO|nr:uncharacterized protein SAPINGB_P005188 [Saprochaete ingens]VVT56634.1 unnamed protein product [Saprochaete ingens]